jgi:isocitrate dehydrogenase
MKLTEGLMKRTFEQVATDYPSIQAHHIIVDNCAHQLVKSPEAFEVIVTSNMNGDILSDLTSGLVGGLGFAPSANLGDDVAIFEAVHGSAPKYAGKNVINPTAVLLSATMMLRHLDEPKAAQDIEDAVAATLEQGLYTRDVKVEGSLSTSAFADAVIAHLGRRSERWRARDQSALRIAPLKADRDYVKPARRRTIGADVFVESPLSPDELGRSLEALVADGPLALKMISNRGTKVYPSMGGLTDCVDHWRCRFVLRDASASLGDAALLGLLRDVAAGHRWMHVEKLEEIEGAAGFTRAQGED